MKTGPRGGANILIVPKHPQQAGSGNDHSIEI